MVLFNSLDIVQNKFLYVFGLNVEILLSLVKFFSNVLHNMEKKSLCM